MRANGSRPHERREVSRLIAYALSAALGLVTTVGPSACTLSTTCRDGRITTDSLPDATVGQPYSFQLVQSCGDRDAASWQLLDDQPPPGIGLSFDGRLFGTPTAPGTFTLNVSVSLSSRGESGAVFPVGTDSRAFELTIRP